MYWIILQRIRSVRSSERRRLTPGDDGLGDENNDEFRRGTNDVCNKQVEDGQTD
jgi:hypothetical protein